jgi:hypothetical protein
MCNEAVAALFVLLSLYLPRDIEKYHKKLPGSLYSGQILARDFQNMKQKYYHGV